MCNSEKYDKTDKTHPSEHCDKIEIESSVQIKKKG